MTRRVLLLFPLAACLRADSEKDVEALLASAASDLSAGNATAFLAEFDHSMADFEKLRTAVVALINQGELSCSLEVLSNDGDDAERALTIDWILRVGPKGESPGSTRREKTVKCRLKKIGKKWRIVSFDPLDLFAPLVG